MISQVAKRGSVLIVEDKEDIRWVVSLILQPNYDITEAENGLEALEKMRGTEFDVILLDENMPEMGGHEFYSIIRKQANLTPVIFCTGLPSALNQKRELGLGAFDYLHKPVDPNNLMLLVDEAYQTKQRLDIKKEQTRV